MIKLFEFSPSVSNTKGEMGFAKLPPFLLPQPISDEHPRCQPGVFISHPIILTQPKPQPAAATLSLAAL